MTDILLKFIHTDHAGRGIYEVHSDTRPCTCRIGCPVIVSQSTGQKIRFDLDGDHRIKVDSVAYEGWFVLPESGEDVERLDIDN